MRLDWYGFVYTSASNRTNRVRLYTFYSNFVETKWNNLNRIKMCDFIFRPLIITSLVLISIGNGSIRACITSLGGSQFEMPSQSKNLNQYFSHYYFIYTLGIMLSKIIPPEIRAQSQCFGKKECYAAVFVVLGTVFLIAWSEYFVWFQCQFQSLITYIHIQKTRICF